MAGKFEFLMPVCSAEDLDDQHGEVVDRHMTSESVVVDPVLAVFGVLSDLRIVWADAMTPAGERGSFTFLIEAVGTGEDTTGGVRPAFLDGSVDNRVEAEDLLDAVGVFGGSPYADPGIRIMRQLRTSKEEGVGLGTVTQGDFRKDASFDDQIEISPLQLFLNAEDLIEDAGLFRIGLLKSETQDLNLGPGDFGIFREPTGGAFHLDTDLLMKGLLVGMVQPVENSSPNIFNMPTNSTQLHSPSNQVYPLYRARG